MSVGGSEVLAGCGARIPWRIWHVLGHPRCSGDPNASAVLSPNHQRCFLSTEGVRFFLFNLSERVMFLLVKLKAGIICGDERLGAVGRAAQSLCWLL